ncbi:hypothetical protein K458DRAFT_384976 [Lentithecium fluviatile CBS 122367]|uniref:Uncharacterized protein n=1 Tax=Lentithecium fluviatile CBS 122367 TaxID=1168545 RepID=A0A6G1JF54_9PLEO|nr:hypothetical protein K458DRAFT_384976 [Lentithecium fluviatile CBS 122367]
MPRRADEPLHHTRMRSYAHCFLFMLTYAFPAPPQPSKAELEIAERQTASDIKWTAAAAAVLYLSPFLVDYARKLV